MRIYIFRQLSTQLICLHFWRSRRSLSWTSYGRLFSSLGGAIVLLVLATIHLMRFICYHRWKFIAMVMLYIWWWDGSSRRWWRTEGCNSGWTSSTNLTIIIPRRIDVKFCIAVSTLSWWTTYAYYTKYLDMSRYCRILNDLNEVRVFPSISFRISQYRSDAVMISKKKIC